MSEVKKKLIIIGAGGHGKVVADTAESSGIWSEINFLDDRFPELELVGCWKVVGKVSEAEKLFGKFTDAAVGIGNNEIRLSFLKKLKAIGYHLPPIIHPSAAVSRYCEIHEGCVLFAQTAVNIGSVLGAGCIINTGATIDHDCTLGEGVHISPGAHLAGTVRIGNCSWIGIGASIKHEIIIEEKVVVGAGAAVVKNLSAGKTVVGVPAK